MGSEMCIRDRPWDADYEDVKAEFPDLFDAEDDRQRLIYLDQVARHAANARQRGNKQRDGA